MIFKKIFDKYQKNKSGNPHLKELPAIIKRNLNIANSEFNQGYNLILKYPKSVSILGSARLMPGTQYYEMARLLGERIAKELDYAVVTGGGPGIMEAANKGTFEAGGKSIGFGIKLPKEQSLNAYLTESVNFEYFFSRKTLLFYSAETYIYFPGGFGTMDELFEILTLMQTSKIPKVPVVLIGSDFWKPLFERIQEELLNDNHTIDPADVNLYKITDSLDEVINIIKTALLRQDK